MNKPCCCGQCGPIPAGVRPHPCVAQLCKEAAERGIDPNLTPLQASAYQSLYLRPIWARRARVALAFLLLLAPSLPVSAAETACKVNVNTASPALLALLVQAGPVLAGKIAAARTAGPLDAAKLDAVPGVGVKWLEYNEPHVTYSGETTCKEKLHKPAAPEAGKGGAK